MLGLLDLKDVKAPTWLDLSVAGLVDSSLTCVTDVVWNMQDETTSEQAETKQSRKGQTTATGRMKT